MDDVTMVIITFNTENKKYINICDDFLYQIKKRIKLYQLDIVVVCLQESRAFTENLVKAFSDCFSNYKKYENSIYRIGKEGLNALRTIVFINPTLETLKPKFNKITLKTKSSLAFNINVKGKDIVVINAHLPFNKKDLPDQGLEERNKAFTYYYETHQKRLGKDFDIHNVFFVGDLNYRMKKNDVYSYNKYYNQLDIPKFQEGIIKFMPTCKLKTCKLPHISTTVKQRNYNKYPNKYPRYPSWCDRILYKGRIKVLLYDAIDYGQTCLSDHIPVFGIYKI